MDELRGERRGVGGKGAGGTEQGLVAVLVGDFEFAFQARRAHEGEAVRGMVDGGKVMVDQDAVVGFVQRGAVGAIAAGRLGAAEGGSLRDGGVDFGELRSAEAGRRKIGGVRDA